MQVADATAALSARATSTSITMFARRQTVTVEIEAPQASAAAVWSMQYIAASSRLTRDEKKSLIRLVALVDQFGGGDPKLMQQVVAIAKMMEADTPKDSYKRHSFAETMEAYWRERATLGDGAAVRIHVETDILLVCMSYEAMRAEFGTPVLSGAA